MNLYDLFKPRWQHSNATIRLAAMAEITNKATLRKIADCSDDERLRLEAARRLLDMPLLRKLARSASDDSIRLKAAITIQDQACLSAIALSGWSIALGQSAVDHIHTALLLRRIAQDAKQDAIRLAAALKLDDPVLLRQVAKSSSQVDIRWQVARRLNDPRMMADIALHKPGNVRVAPMRRKARQALMDYLDRSQQKNDTAALRETITASPHLAFKLEAFVRLPPEEITLSLLLYMANQEMRYISNELLGKMLAQIKRGGWRLWPSVEKSPCVHCQGSGALTLRSVSANDTWNDHDQFPCPECEGKGDRTFRHVACKRGQEEVATFRLPE